MLISRSVHNISDSQCQSLYVQNLQLRAQCLQQSEENKKYESSIAGLQRSKEYLKQCIASFREGFGQTMPGDTPYLKKVNQNRERYAKHNMLLKDYEDEILTLKKKMKVTQISTLKASCCKLQTESLDLHIQIQELAAKNKILQGQPSKLTELNNHDDSVTLPHHDSDDSFHNESQLEAYSKEIDNLKRLIQKEQDKRNSLIQKKESMGRLVESYNKIQSQMYNQTKVSSSLDKTILQLTEKVNALDRHLDSQYHINHQLKSRLFDKDDHELKQTKNLKEQIEKCTEQCKEIKNKYLLALNKIGGKNLRGSS